MAGKGVIRRFVVRRATLVVLGIGGWPSMTWAASALGVAQSIGSMPTQNIAAATRPAERELQHVAVHVKDAPLPSVLQNIAHQAGLVLVYDDALIPAGTLVTLNLHDVTADLAFTEALRGTGLTARVHPNGDVVIARGSAVMLDSVITGRVVDSTTKQPIVDVHVTIEGTKIVTTTDEHGHFRLRGAAEGTYKLTFRRIGYRSNSTSVVVGDGKTVRLAISLQPAPNELTRVVTTASGDRSRLETGNSVGVIQADSVVGTALIRNLSDLLTARTPGVVVQNPSGLVGAPSRIRMRGINSLQLNNDPIIILDGVRIPAQTTFSALQTSTSDQSVVSTSASGVASSAPLAPSRLDDIDPNSIESIEVLRGPSAAAQYGPDASNGVIVIKTKRGKPGPWRTTFSADQGWSQPRGQQPTYWYGWNTNISPGAGFPYNGCTLADLGALYSVEAGTCRIDSVTHYTPLSDPRLSNQGTGTQQRISGTLSGGTEQLRQSVTASYSDVVGMLKMSQVQKDLISELWTHPAPSWMTQPNTEKSYDVSSATTVSGGQRWDLNLNAMGAYRNLLTARPGYSNLTSPRSAADSLSYLPGLEQRERTTSDGTHGTGSAQLNVRPLSWFSMSAVGGGDYSTENGEDLLRAEDCTPVVDQSDVNGTLKCASGRTVRRRQTFNKSGTINGTITGHPFSWLKSDTYLSETFSKVDTYALESASGGSTDLAFGSNLLSPSPVPRYDGAQAYTTDESRDASASASWSISETVGLRNTMYFTSGYQRDAASAIGSRVNDKAPFYPKVNGSWLLSEESFYPRNRWIPTLRLRGAYGRSGNQPSQAAILGGFSENRTIDNGSDSYGMLLTSVGNPDLRPERSTEGEFGADGSLFSNDRITFGFSLYHKHTDDAIVSVPLPPSYGIGTLSKTVNVGSIQNNGTEFETTVRLVDRRALAWSVSVNGSANRNKLLHKDPSFPSDNGTDANAYTEGYPTFGYWGFPILSYADRNGDGILERSEIAFGPVAFMGAPYPRSNINYATNVVMWGALSFSANIAQINGQSNRYSVTGKSVGGRPLVDKTTSIAEQAAAIQAYLQGGYINEYTSVRLGEASVSYTIPPRLAQRWFHVETASIGLTGRNLGLWTNYAGNDPNVDQAAKFNEQQTDDGTGIAQPREWTIRFHLGF